MLKPFCDLCGEPGLSNSFILETLKEQAPAYGKAGIKSLRILAECTENSENHPKSDDKRWHICPKCLAAGLRKLADQADQMKPD